MDRDHSAFATLALRREDYGGFDRANIVQPTRPILESGALRRITAAGWRAPKVRVRVIIDASGPGQVAIELIRAQKLDITFTPALLTAVCDSGHSQSGKLTIPRRELISNLRYLLEVELLRVHPDLTHKKALEAEHRHRSRRLPGQASLSLTPPPRPRRLTRLPRRGYRAATVRKRSPLRHPILAPSSPVTRNCSLTIEYQ